MRAVTFLKTWGFVSKARPAKTTGGKNLEIPDYESWYTYQTFVVLEKILKLSLTFQN